MRFGVTVADEGEDYEDSVVIFRASGWDSALARALEVGRGMEEVYDNADGETVRRRLIVVRTLDELGDELTDGREIYSMRVARDQGGDDPERPEDSEPTQTGV